ncbi:hypothetical protein ACS0PU_000977 [Formica fusca]
MQENTLVPSEGESDEELADNIEKQYLPKTRSATSSATDQSARSDTCMTTRSTVKRPANYPIQEPPPTRRKGNPTRSHTELMNKLEESEEREKTILANQEIIKANQLQIVERLDRIPNI